MSHCQSWECKWHGCDTEATASMCDYAALHTAYDIPGDDKIRGCPPGDKCEKYEPDDRFMYQGTTHIDGKARAKMFVMIRRKPTAAAIKRHQTAWRNYQTQTAAAEQAHEKRVRRTRPKVKIDHEKALELYDKHYNDMEIALELGCSQYAVTRWRAENNLPGYYTINQKDRDCSLLKKYHAEGLSDGQIARLIGIPHSTVSTRRNALGLPANFAPKSGKKVEK